MVNHNSYVLIDNEQRTFCGFNWIFAVSLTFVPETANIMYDSLRIPSHVVCHYLV
jgi:hypothetical protein